MRTQSINPTALRKQFPALSQSVNGQTAVFLDGPGGTQVPQSVLDAMTGYLINGSSNQGGSFLTSRLTDQTVDNARQAMMDFLNANRPEEIVFGQNMTSLNFHLSRSLSRTWQQGDEIIVTRIDHDANISPWLLAAQDRGATVRWLDFHPQDCTLALETLPRLLTERTQLIAISMASNAVGTISDVKKVIKAAQTAGAVVVVDAVHFAPHGVLDVQSLGCDFLLSSAYKYFGPHTGIMYGKYNFLESLPAYKVRPAPDKPAAKWETGTPSFESLAGVTAAVDYIASLGGNQGSRRERIVKGMTAVAEYEEQISRRFLEGATAVPGLKVYGITDIERLDERTPTFAISLEGFSPAQVSKRLGEQGFFVWDGHYYAVAVMERLGLHEKGGLVRIGFVHYNTFEEVDRVLAALKEMTQK